MRAVCQPLRHQDVWKTWRGSAATLGLRTVSGYSVLQAALADGRPSSRFAAHVRGVLLWGRWAMGDGQDGAISRGMRSVEASDESQAHLDRARPKHGLQRKVDDRHGTCGQTGGAMSAGQRRGRQVRIGARWGDSCRARRVFAICRDGLSNSSALLAMQGHGRIIGGPARSACGGIYHKLRSGSRPFSSASVRLRHWPGLRWPSLMLTMRTRRNCLTR